MLPANSRSEYERRMHRVTEHIDRALDQPLDLATLAGVAHFSPYHFHRLFTAWMGETLGDYLRRRRVEVAALRLLAQPRLRVLDAALSVGFGSGEAFSRAFRQHFGSAPSTWRLRQGRREERKPGQVNGKPGQAPPLGAGHTGSLFNQPTEPAMKVTVINRAPARVAYVRHTGPYGKPISQFWQTSFFPWASANGLLGQARYGISHDDPCVTDPALCRYDACVEVGADFVPAQLANLPQAFTTTVPGGQYAALAFKGTVAQLGEAWMAILRDWLPASGLQLDARPSFEFYPNNAFYDPQSGVMGCDICIPVAPL